MYPPAIIDLLIVGDIMNKQVDEAILKIATKNKSVADLLINYNPENKSVIEEAKQELKKGKK